MAKKKRGWAFRSIRVLVVLLVVLAGAAWLGWFLPAWGMPFNGLHHLHPPITPPWALECWLWEDDHNTEAYLKELIAGYKQHDLPVRAVLIDSPWSERYNDFAVDQKRYPDPAKFFHDLKSQGYRIVLWMTCLVNKDSTDAAIKDSSRWYEQAKSKGYLTDHGRLAKWWKGHGGFIDYTNPAAMKWWHGMQQQVLDWGADGWKLDGTATINAKWMRPPRWLGIHEIPFAYIRTKAGLMTTRGYMNHYYRDEYHNGLAHNKQFVTLSRSMDGLWNHPEGWAPLDAAPVCWVGDEHHDWSDKNHGLETALKYILTSAKLGYCVVGSDVAGYQSSVHKELKAKIPEDIYIRWAQFSTFCGLFLNGGHGDREIWKNGPQELDIIRRAAWLHNELVPYMYTYVVNCHNGGKPLMRPLARKAFKEIGGIKDYRYMFGDDFFVSPIYRPVTKWKINLPVGRWRYLYDDRKVLTGPATVEQNFPLDQFPVYIRDGAIIPLNVTRPYTGFGDKNSAGFLTLAIYPHGSSRFTIHNTDGSGDTTVAVDQSGGKIDVRLTGVHKPHILRVLVDKEPASVALDGHALAKGKAWHYDGAGHLIVKTKTYGAGHYVIAMS